MTATIKQNASCSWYYRIHKKNLMKAHYYFFREQGPEESNNRRVKKKIYSVKCMRSSTRVREWCGSEYKPVEAEHHNRTVCWWHLPTKENVENVRPSLFQSQRLRCDLTATRQQAEQQFPDYQELMAPKSQNIWVLFGVNKKKIVPSTLGHYFFSYSGWKYQLISWLLY